MSKPRKAEQPKRTCGECYHEYACFYAAGGCGALTNTDATHCVNFETLTEIIEKNAKIFGYEKRNI